jgi:hypothetical protein
MMEKREQPYAECAPAGRLVELARCERNPTVHRPQRVVDMLLAHRIRLDPTPVQRDYFARAAGTARRVWNWALAQWQRQASAGLRLRHSGVDLGVSAAATVSSGEQIPAPRPLRAALRRLRIRHRRQSRKIKAAQRAAGMAGPSLPRKPNGSEPNGRHRGPEKRRATGACAAQSALPVASLAATSGTAAGMGSAGGGKVTPVRHEHGRPDGSGQEQNDAHFRAHF